MHDAVAWAEAEFGGAELGDVRRTRRLIQVVSEAARRPGGTVSRVCTTSASREGAFRLLESDAVKPAALRTAMESAALRRCRGEHRVIVAIDGSSLTVTDEAAAKGLGGVGAWHRGARGVQTMTALAVTTHGSTLGICGQRMWVRSRRSKHGERGAQGKTSENRFWLELLRDVSGSFADEVEGCTPWFQLDRGADGWEVLSFARKAGLLMTVRAAHDRRVGVHGRLWAALETARVVGKRTVAVPKRPATRKKTRVNGKRTTRAVPARPSRTARLTIRAATVPVMCRAPNGRVFEVDLNAVFVRERRRSDDRVEWMLLTTHPIATKRDVLAVVDAYALRWRVEDFHRTWKRGLCRVEDTQLRSRDAIFKWATILAAVATRAMRLTHLARESPDTPASAEFSATEIAAVVMLREPPGFDGSTSPTLAQAVRWIAEIGGYTGPWNGPPGVTVIGRGLYDVLVAARVLEKQRTKR
jgi:hypothetical protein